MSKEFENPTKWNEFYEHSWFKHKEIMISIIASGESHLMRIINLLSSDVRFSQENDRISELEGHDPKLIFKSKNGYAMNDIRNVEVIDSHFKITPKQHVPTGMRADIQVAHRNTYSLTSSYSKCDKINFLVDYCRLRKFDAVVELGSGYSQNLIKLFYQGGPRVPYYGGEFTQSGTECAQMLSDLTDDFELIPFRFDFRKPDFSMIGKYDNVLVFSCHAIEQVNLIPDDLLTKISALSKQVTCIHIEPFGFQLAPSGSENEVDKNHRNFFHENGWNMNLLNQLLLHNRKKNIDLQYIGRNILGGSDSYNPSSLALWKSITTT
ncbi:MAG: hypothetical protein RPT25_11460 [Cycloclasticus sp.]|jgi:hypothetical protein